MSNSTSTFPAKLLSCWHPVGYTAQLKPGKVQGTTLLDHDVAIWRSSDGEVHAVHDLCIHRGTALSLGWIKDDCLVCPYHGWRYNRLGDCALIPQAPDVQIPEKAKTPVYRCTERFGIIWVALQEPVYPLPDIPEFLDPDWKFVTTGPFSWNSDASRQLENFTDLGHFPWVHPGLLGDPDRPEVPHCKVTANGAILEYAVVRPEASNTDDFPIFANAEVVKPERRSAYNLHLPYTILLRLGWGGTEGMIYLFASQPMTANTCKGYTIIGRNYNLDEPDTVIQDFEQVIFDQDKRIVESQRPDKVPFDFAEELHLKFDAVAVQYRRAMKKEGLSY